MGACICFYYFDDVHNVPTISTPNLFPRTSNFREHGLNSDYVRYFNTSVFPSYLVLSAICFFLKKNFEFHTLQIRFVIHEIKMWSLCIHCIYVYVYKHVHIYGYSCITTKTGAFSDCTYWHGFVSSYGNQINNIHWTTQDCIAIYLYNKH